VRRCSSGCSSSSRDQIERMILYNSQVSGNCFPKLRCAVRASLAVGHRRTRRGDVCSPMFTSLQVKRMVRPWGFTR
jgi:hypothetical protein